MGGIVCSWAARICYTKGQQFETHALNMDGFGSGERVDVEKGKGGRTRRTWSKIEEDALVHCLIEIVNNGWKADNGFKAGFQRELEKGMRVMMPGTDILATPHINSKIHTWKKDYSSLFDVLSKTGIGWNCTTNTIDEGAWEAQQKVDPHLKGMRYKSWPYYLQWQDIFGKDRATGENAMDAIDIVNEFLRNSYTGESASVDKNNTVGDIPEHVEENTPVSKSSEPADKKGKGVKRKAVESEITHLVDTLGEFMKNSDETFGSIASRMGGEKDAKTTHMSLNDIMKGILGLSLRDNLKSQTNSYRIATAWSIS
ncbi:hypothetical protein ACS0TY_031683 [Phlomoides rotata]